MKKVKILKSLINEISLDEFIDQLLTSKKLKVAVCNANSLVRSYKNKKLLEIMNNFDISLPDGFPVAKASSLLYKNKQKFRIGKIVKTAHDILYNNNNPK